ncbi:flagellar basal body L-ring protein FlgH [Hydrogenophaga sp. NFH-34]|uniref:flagellar basal body L-ring protein FlgH n=1 Tax=Hydrogenophaga sp. NFH-34 TaxID=2744446 RepID=UPI001F282EE1|nr:flagellar basal body L-ring protein FlgH [Hydrogenophaga sp. NFH-34]
MKRTLLSLSFWARWVGLGALLALAGCTTQPVEVLPATPIQYPAAPQAPAVATGGIFQAVAYRPAFEDARARLPGDTLTIQITEKVSASQSSTASLDRSGSVSGSVSAIPGIRAKELTRDRNFNLGGESSNTFSGKGDNENANDFSGVITVTVQQVLPNGHLVVVGDKQIGVNHNVDVLRFSGTVDPRNIRPGNVVASTQVANARIESKGRGATNEALSIGWLGRFFLNVMPF